jgi:hypothetical protein
MIHCHCKLLVLLLQRVSGLQSSSSLGYDVNGRPKPVFLPYRLEQPPQMRCRVETYSGYRLHERPRRFTWGETWLEVRQIMEEWMAPGYLCFKVRVDDRAYLLQYNQAQDVWEVELIKPRIRPWD